MIRRTLKAISKIFLRGLAVILPAGLTIWILYWIGTEGSRLMADLVEELFDYDKDDGWWLGLLLAFGVVLLVGLLTQAFLIRNLIRFGERILARMPLVKTIYGPLKDMMGFFAAGDDRQLGKVVMVRVGTLDLVGFITRESAASITKDSNDTDRVVVYLPLSYQIGGFMVTVPHSDVRPLDIGPEEAMRLAITAGIQSRDN